MSWEGCLLSYPYARRKTREDDVLIVWSIDGSKFGYLDVHKNKIDQVVVFGLLLLLRGVCFAVAVSGAFETNSSCLLNKYPRIPARLSR